MINEFDITFHLWGFLKDISRNEITATKNWLMSQYGTIVYDRFVEEAKKNNLVSERGSKFSLTTMGEDYIHRMEKK